MAGIPFIHVAGLSRARHEGAAMTSPAADSTTRVAELAELSVILTPRSAALESGGTWFDDARHESAAMTGPAA